MASKKKTTTKPVTPAEFKDLASQVRALNAVVGSESQIARKLLGALESRLDQFVDVHNDLVAGYNDLRKEVDFLLKMQLEQTRGAIRRAEKRLSQLEKTTRGISKSALN